VEADTRKVEESRKHSRIIRAAHGETNQPELSGLFHGIEAALGFQHGDPVRARLVEKLTQFRSLSE
jgi:hypothetical protein